MTDPTPIVRIEDLSLVFHTYVGDVKALDRVTLDIRRDETLGLVGESGCGKSVTALSLLRLNPVPPAEYTSGTITFTPERGPRKDILRLRETELRTLRGNDISMIFQEPMTSLNPVMRIGDQIAEAVLEHQDLGVTPLTGLERALESRKLLLTNKLRERRRRALDVADAMLRRIGIPDSRAILSRFPHELSGGMRQRVMIAMAIACKPDLLIADEPTTALDVTIQAQIMELIKDLKREERASILLITHHLGLVAEICDRVAVMYAGSVVETATTRDMFHAPRHPYTVGLLKSIPELQAGREPLPVIAGFVPDLIDPPQGCRFHPRCPYAIDVCRSERPPMFDAGEDHRVACHLYDGAHDVPRELGEAAGVGRPGRSR
ncbi:MAG: ABC transporter ATP-binding protein [Euryarchaeota archaeon]|nr:ABC transporter ATP-binding protein [Euryarchaeota archaeon]